MSHSLTGNTFHHHDWGVLSDSMHSSQNMCLPNPCDVPILGPSSPLSHLYACLCLHIPCLHQCPRSGPCPPALSARCYFVQQLKGRVPLLDPLLEILQADRCGLILPLHGRPDDLDIMLRIVHCLQHPHTCMRPHVPAHAAMCPI